MGVLERLWTKFEEGGGLVNPSDYETFREQIIENIRTVLSLTEDNPLMERYNVQNLESYLRSLEILERINKGGATWPKS